MYVNASGNLLASFYHLHSFILLNFRRLNWEQQNLVSYCFTLAMGANSFFAVFIVVIVAQPKFVENGFTTGILMKTNVSFLTSKPKCWQTFYFTYLLTLLSHFFQETLIRLAPRRKKLPLLQLQSTLMTVRRESITLRVCVSFYDVL